MLSFASVQREELEMRYVGGILVCLSVALTGCDGETGDAPVSLAGTWQFLVLNSGCPEISGVLDNNGGVAAQVFDVSQSGQTVSAARSSSSARPAWIDTRSCP
jgi:hypothetical protein